MSWADRAMENMAGRRRDSPEVIVRRLRRAYGPTAAGKAEQEIAA